MSQGDRRIAQGEWVLVTGANGYIASHVIDVLLDQGYNVRGTVRNEKAWLNKYFENKYGTGRFETHILTAMEKESAFDEAVKGVSGVIHIVCSTPRIYLNSAMMKWILIHAILGYRCIIHHGSQYCSPQSRCRDSECAPVCRQRALCQECCADILLLGSADSGAKQRRGHR